MHSRRIFDAIAEAATNRNTVEGYAKKFRQIVSEIFSLSDGDRKHDYQKGGLQEWLTKVHSVRLADVSPSRVQQWKRSFLAKAGSDPVAMRKLRISVNSMLRQARSLFSPKRVRHLSLSLPAPLPFEGVEFEPRQSMKYRSEIDIEGLIRPRTMSLGTLIRRRTRFFCWVWRWVFDERRSICSSGPPFTGGRTLSELNQLGIFIRRARIQSRIFPLTRK